MKALTKMFMLTLTVLFFSYSGICSEIKSPIQEKDVAALTPVQNQFVVKVILDKSMENLMLEVTLKNPKYNIDAFGFRVKLPGKGLEYSETQFGKIVEGWQFIGANPKGDKLTVGGFDPSKSIESKTEGVLAMIRFKIKDSSAVKEYVNSLNFYDLVDDIEGFKVTISK